MLAGFVVAEFAGAGKTLTPDIDWDSELGKWFALAEHAAAGLRAGDVRLARLHSLQSARPLSLLSRSRELLHDV